MTDSPRTLASRANGARSKAPITPAGKCNSSRNSIRHGMLAQTVVLERESQDRFHELLSALTLQFHPRTAVEIGLVETMAVARWRQMRIWGIQKAGFDLEMARHQHVAESLPVRAAIVFRHLADNSRVLDLAQRYETAFDRQFARAISLLIKLRSQPDHDTTLTPGPECAALTWDFPDEPTNPVKTDADLTRTLQAGGVSTQPPPPDPPSRSLSGPRRVRVSQPSHDRRGNQPRLARERAVAVQRQSAARPRIHE